MSPAVSEDSWARWPLDPYVYIQTQKDIPMSLLQSQLRSEPVTAVFNMSAMIFRPSLLGYLVVTVFTILAMLPFILRMFNADLDLMIDLLDTSNPFEQSRMMQSVIEDCLEGVVSDPLVMILALGFVLVAILVGAWYYNLLFIGIEHRMKGHRPKLSEMMSSSFNKNITWIAGANLLIVFIMMGIGALGAVLAVTVSPILVLPLVVFLGVLAMRFIVVYPFIVHADQGIGEAISSSFRLVGWGRAFRYFGAGILAFLALMVSSMVLGLVQVALAMIPMIGMVLYFIANLALSAFISGLVISTMSGVYYRHTEDLQQEGGIALEDHLLI